MSVATASIISADEFPSAMEAVLDEVGAVEALSGFSRIIIKPNIVNSSPPPITTDVRCVEALVRYLADRLDAEIVVAEGSGEGDTIVNMDRNGYREIGVPLVDLDSQPVKTYSDSRAAVYREVHLPDYLEGAALVSVPPAKDHTITRTTLGLKNMVGCLHAKHYGGYWSYKKSQVHNGDEDQIIADLILYLEPHLTVIDARQGAKGGHLSGVVPDPPLGKLLAGTDVIEVDREACRILGHDPDSVRYLSLASALRDGSS